MFLLEVAHYLIDVHSYYFIRLLLVIENESTKVTPANGFKHDFAHVILLPLLHHGE
jgi:hypothetical protein